MIGSENKAMKGSLSSIGPETLSDAPETTAALQSGASNGSLNKLAPALAKAQAELKNATLNKTNPHFKSRYADLAGIRDTVTPVLAKHGFSIIQTTEVSSSGFFLVTMLLHESGQHISGRYPLPELLDKPQAMGSAVTYARRYALSAMCGIAAEEDDDGEAAQNSNGRGQAKGGASASAKASRTDTTFDAGGGIIL